MEEKLSMIKKNTQENVNFSANSIKVHDFSLVNDTLTSKKKPSKILDCKFDWWFVDISASFLLRPALPLSFLFHLCNHVIDNMIDHVHYSHYITGFFKKDIQKQISYNVRNQQKFMNDKKCFGCLCVCVMNQDLLIKSSICI